MAVLPHAVKRTFFPRNLSKIIYFSLPKTFPSTGTGLIIHISTSLTSHLYANLVAELNPLSHFRANSRSLSGVKPLKKVH